MNQLISIYKYFLENFVGKILFIIKLSKIFNLVVLFVCLYFYIMWFSET